MPVAAGSVAAFLGLFGFLTYELGTGHDPALSRQAKATLQPAPKRVVVKRVEHRIVVTKVLPPEEDDVPVVQPAPATAPAVVVQPAPAPAPAPVVTRSS